MKAYIRKNLYTEFDLEKNEYSPAVDIIVIQKRKNVYYYEIKSIAKEEFIVKDKLVDQSLDDLIEEIDRAYKQFDVIEIKNENEALKYLGKKVETYHLTFQDQNINAFGLGEIKVKDEKILPVLSNNTYEKRLRKLADKYYDEY